MKEVISDVEQEKFSDFSAKVKTSLEDKLRNNPIVQSKSDELKRMQNIQNTFAKIRLADAPEVSNDLDDDIPAQDED